MQHRRLSILFTLALAACGTSAADTAPSSDSADAAVADSTVVAPADTTPAATAPEAAGIVRGLYVNRWATMSSKRMRELIAMADSTEVNALVLDLKDEFGLNYESKDPEIRRNAGNAGTIPRLQALLDTLEAHDIHSIARLVVFKDSVAARVNPDRTIRTPSGATWRDKQGLAWVNPYDPVIREYNIKVAEELARMGFDEIQFDYIRFPEPYASLPTQVFPNQNGVSKPRALRTFLEEACPRIRKAGALCTIDIFGLVTTVKGPLEIGQEWEELSPVVDVVLPMTYPSHYPRGSYGIDRPNAAPYEIQKIAITGARERDAKLGITTPEHVRPWIQAFTLGPPPYGPAEIEAQKRGIYDAGYEGWILWHPGSKYESFLPGLEKTLEPRAKRATAAR